MEVNIPKVGDIIKGTVVKVDKEEVLVDVGYMFEGTIFKEHLTLDKVEDATEVFSVGDEIEAKVTKISHGDDDNVLLLSRIEIEKNKIREQYRDDLEVDADVVARVKRAVKGGLLLDYHTIELFLPDSLITLGRISDEEKKKLVGKEIKVRIIDVRKERRRTKYIANRKTIEYDEAKAKEQEEIDQLEVGQVIKGTVTNTVKFGAFVRVTENVEGLVHISELSHHHVDKTEDVLSVGDEVEVKIIKIKGKRISLSIKALQESPWEKFLKEHKVGDKVTAKVVKKMGYGMLMEVEPDVVGLLNRYDYSWNPNDNLAGRVEEGDELEVEITSINEDKKQFTLSKKHLEYNPWADLKIKRGDFVSATVKEIKEKGAVVEVEEVEGFLPIGEISKEHIDKVEDVLSVDDIMTVEVKQFNPKQWKLIVSLKDVEEKKNRKAFEKELNKNVSASQSLADLFEDFKK